MLLYLRSGTEEEYSELDSLLQDLADRLADHALLKKDKKGAKISKEAEVEAAEAVRNAAMTSMVVIQKSNKIIVNEWKH